MSNIVTTGHVHGENNEAGHCDEWQEGGRQERAEGGGPRPRAGRMILCPEDTNVGGAPDNGDDASQTAPGDDTDETYGNSKSISDSRRAAAIGRAIRRAA